MATKSEKLSIVEIIEGQSVFMRDRDAHEVVRIGNNGKLQVKTIAPGYFDPGGENRVNEIEVEGVFGSNITGKPILIKIKKD